MITEIETEDPRQCWATPKGAWQWIADTFGPFDLDVCADAENTKCQNYIAHPSYVPTAWDRTLIGLDAMVTPWKLEGGEETKCWCNPGFSQAWEWMIRAQNQAEEHDAHTFLLMHGTWSPEWFDYFLGYVHRIHALRPRFNFTPKGTVKASSNPKDSILFEFKRGAQFDGVIHIAEPWKPIPVKERMKRGLHG